MLTRLSPGRILTIRSLILIGFGCSKIGTEGEGEPPLDVEPSLESIRTNVFQPSCAFANSCHNQDSREGDLILGCALDTNGDGNNDHVAKSSSGQLRLVCWELINVPAINPLETGLLVRPFEARASVLIRKLEGDDLDVGNERNCPMPWNGACDTSSRLSESVIAVIRQWIDDGAPGCAEPRPAGTIDWNRYCEDDGLLDASPPDAGASDANSDAGSSDGAGVDM